MTLLANLMIDIVLNPTIKTSLTTIGNENIPVLVIDDFIQEPNEIISWVEQEISNDRGFSTQTSDYYPGVRKVTPTCYTEQIKLLLPQLKQMFDYNTADSVEVIMSEFSIATTPIEKLRPIQMLPHFDTLSENQLAMVHYLCDVEHGGTSFYRHKKTGFERISESRFSQYSSLLKQQAIAEKLHETPHYIEGDSRLFDQIHSVEAQMNRVVIYPSNALHSGNVRPQTGLSQNVRRGRLTVSSFIVLT